jgi:hypothetical protein
MWEMWEMGMSFGYVLPERKKGKKGKRKREESVPSLSLPRGVLVSEVDCAGRVDGYGISSRPDRGGGEGIADGRCPDCRPGRVGLSPRGRRRDRGTHLRLLVVLADGGHIDVSGKLTRSEHRRAGHVGRLAGMRRGVQAGHACQHGHLARIAEPLCLLADGGRHGLAGDGDVSVILGTHHYGTRRVADVGWLTSCRSLI